MPHVPNFPSPSEDENDGRDADRGSIIDRIIDGNFPTVAGDEPLSGARPAPR